MNARGEGIAQAKLTEAMVIDARCWAAEGRTITDIIGRLGIDISRPTMSKAINGRTWAYLNETFPPQQAAPVTSQPGRSGVPIGTRRSVRTLSAEQVREIRQAKAAGATSKEVADRYGISKTLVDEIAHRRQYAHVPDQEES